MIDTKVVRETIDLHFSCVDNLDGVRVQKKIILDMCDEIDRLTAECNAWREDADRLRELILDYEDFVSGADMMKYDMDTEAIDHHRQLHERYPTEKSDTAKGE